MNNIFANIEIEKKVLINALHDIKDLEYIIPNLDVDCFTELTHQRLYDLIFHFYKEYSHPLSQKALEIQLQKENYSRKEKIDVQVLYLELSSRTADKQTRFYTEELKNLKTKRQLRGVHSVLKRSLEDPSTIAEELLSEIMNKVLNISRDTANAEIVRTTLLNAREERWKEYIDKEQNPEKYKGIPLGYDEIDSAFAGGGIFPSWVGLLFGRTGVGKSRMLFNIGCNVAKENKAVMYITIEMEAKILQHMWESRELLIPLDKILNATLSTEDKEKYKNFLNSPKPELPFTVIDIPRGCSPAMLESEILLYSRVNGKVPDLVLIDYVNLMRPNERYEKNYEKFDALLKELKQVARICNVPIITAMQQNRESLKAKEIGLEHIALSDQAAHHCDFICNLKRDDVGENSYQQNNSCCYLIVKFLKNRFGPEKTCRLLADFARNRIINGRDFLITHHNAQSQDEKSDEDADF